MAKAKYNKDQRGRKLLKALIELLVIRWYAMLQISESDTCSTVMFVVNFYAFS